jgi:anhydro-N-acetylmuramic acid kinase
MAGELFIGLMSGTSLDGIDAALVEFNLHAANGEQPKVICTHYVPYEAELRNQILALQHPTQNELEFTEIMGNTLARCYAVAVHQLLKISQKTAHDIIAIGNHGQTIRHRPELGFTMQIGNPALLAELSGITVVADFRSRDIAAGGQGAPLVPAFHRALFAHQHFNRAIINIGGIANITYLSRTGQVFGFDSGPGNMLLDMWIKHHLNLDYDADGTWARSGKVIVTLLKEMLAEPYFNLPPPKSTGRDLFNATWLNHYLFNKDYAANDIACTLVALSAHSIYDALMKYCNDVDEVYLCGGGAKNGLLTEELKTLLGNKKLGTTDFLGIGIDWVEAVAFAWLAKQCLDRKTASLPEITGAKGARILGAIYQN